MRRGKRLRFFFLDHTRIRRGRIASNDRQLKSSVVHVKEDRDGEWIVLE